MPYVLRWYYEKRVIHNVFYGTITRADIEANQIDLQRMIAEGTPRMYVLVDTASIAHSEVGLKEIRAVFSVPVGLDIVAWTVIVGMNIAARFFASVVIQMMNHRFRFLKDELEAIEFIRSIDDSLKDMPLTMFELEPYLREGEHTTPQ
jgi:hypothetical protein